MKIAITGGKGMLGRTLQKKFAGDEVVVADLPEWDITDGEAFTAKLAAEKPDVVIHWRNVAIACKACGARLLAISTDYVFSGEPPVEPWAWSETDIPAPRTVYGASKLGGEQAISMICPDATILRIAWLYGSGGPSFVHTMAKLGAENGAPLKVVDDQRGNPTSCDAVADVLRFLISRPDISGVVHGTCEDACSWYEFACEIKRLVKSFRRDIVPCTTEEFPRPAPRPKNSALKKSVLNKNGYRTPNWKIALADFVKTEFPELQRFTGGGGKGASL